MFLSAAGGISLPGLAIPALAEPLAGRRPIPGLRFPFPAVGRSGGYFRRRPRKNTVGFIDWVYRKDRAQATGNIPVVGEHGREVLPVQVLSLTVALGLIKRPDKKGW